MAETGLNGYWKGLLVSSSIHPVVHVHLEQVRSALTGRFEAPELPSPHNKGELTGSVDGTGKVTLTVKASPAAEFTGQALVEGSVTGVLYGVVRVAGVERAIGTLTLFRKGVDPIFDVY